MNGFQGTILERRRGTVQKQATRLGDGTYTFGADPLRGPSGERWLLRPFQAADNDAMAAALCTIARHGRQCLVMGAPPPGVDLSVPHVRYSSPSRPDEERMLRDAERSCFVADVDKALVPTGLGRPEKLSEAATYIRDNLLPPDCHGIACVVSRTASTGLNGDTVMSCRLWFTTSRFYPLSRLWAWGREMQASGFTLDPSVLLPGQLIVIAAPRCTNFADPFGAADEAFVLPGVEKAVRLDLAPEPSVPLQWPSSGSAGHWWVSLVRTFTGGTGGCHEPLKSAIGMAVAHGATEDEVVVSCLQLIAERATPEKQRQYTDAWLRRTYRSFARRTAEQVVRAEAARAELFRYLGLPNDRLGR